MATQITEQEQLIRLAFEVPKGFEDVAWQDIKRFLPPSANGSASCSDHVKLLSGWILLALSAGPTLNACLSTYAEGSFWAVTRVLLSLQTGHGALEDLPALSAEICEGLEAERKSLPSKRSRQIINPDISKSKNSRYRRRVAPLDMDTTPHELAFIERLSNIAKAQQQSHATLYTIWKASRHGDQAGGATETDPQSFAVRFERRDFMFPTLKSAKISFYLAEQYGAHIITYTGKDAIKADLTSPEYEILTELIQQDGKWLCLSGISLPAPKTPNHRLDRIRGRTTLVPERAYCICLMHPDLRSPGNSSRAMLFLDPCSGLGSIPIEIAAIAKRDGKKIVSLAADNELPSLENAAINSKRSSVDGLAGLNGLDKGLLWTGYGKRHSGGFREGVIDGIVTDLPWGIRELSSKAISALYPALLRFLGEAVIDGGVGVFLCQRDRVFLAAVQSNYKMWEVLEQQEANVEGVQVYVFVIKRKNRAEVNNIAK